MWTRGHSDVLVERDSELEQVAEHVADALGGAGRLVLIEGPAGIGKSRLLGELRGRAERSGARILTARGSELEREFPFGVVRQLFEPLLRDPAERERLLGGGAAPARAVFEPLTAEPTGTPSDPSFASLHGLYWLTVEAAGDESLILAIDDLHWCDGASLRFLAYLARRLADLPVLVGTTLRPAEQGANVTLIGEVTGDPAVAALHPGPLSRAAVLEVARERVGQVDAEFGDACHAATGGNPLLLHELLRAIEGEQAGQAEPPPASVVSDLGPRATSRAVLMRLARLPEAAAAVARAVAVLGDNADIGAVAELAEVDQDEAAAQIAALAQAEVLRHERPIGFIHPLVHDVIYHDLPPGERELLHGRAAQLLADAGAPAEQVAAHVLVMPRRGEEWVVDVLTAAAHRALEQGAAESAVAYFRRALEEPPPRERATRVRADLGISEALTSGPAAAEHLSAAFEEVSDPVERGWIGAVLTDTLTFTGRFSDATDVARRASRDLGEDQSDLRNRLRASRIVAARFDPRHDPEGAALLTAADVENLGPGTGPRTMEAMAAFDMACLGAEPASRCVELALRAFAGGGLIEGANGSGSFAAGMYVLALADRDEALGVADAALAEAHKRGSLFAACGAHTFRGFTLSVRGDLAAAAESLRAGRDAVAMWGIEPGRAHVSAFLADVLLEQGDVAGARAALEWAGLPDVPPPNLQLSWWLVARAKLALAEGRHQKAIAYADDLVERVGGLIENPAWVPWRTLKADALVALGREDEARALALEELEAARRWGAPRTVGRALRTVGSIERGDEGIERMTEAVALLEDSPARLELARCLAELGAHMRLARRQSDAREPLRRALELASACSAPALADRARTELYASGARPRTDAQSGAGALTPSERRVVDLAVEGGSNREIAQELYVTPKTVEVHLSNAYRKLGIKSRRELAEALLGA